MDFLLAHQRADGKMMHEYSQTAETVNWADLPYLYASADSTPLFVMQMEDYVRTSGDTVYLREHWESVKRAYAFTRAHTTNGVYDNSQGTGWIEEWIPKMPHQEIYLASLDQQSSDAIARLADVMNDPALASSARNTGSAIRAKLTEFRGSDGMYAFNRNADGSFERVSTIFPSVAWWSGHLSLPDADPMFQQWAAHTFSTDWGTRSVPTTEAIYDPISYHHGSVWPLYTGWVSMAEFRAGHSLAGLQHLMQNVKLTWLQDPGAITEVLSGFAYEPLGRSSSHQLWSSSMVLSPAIGGMFGLQADALQHTLRIDPHLPADWDRATLRNVHVGEDVFDMTFLREGGSLRVEAVSRSLTQLCLVHAGNEEAPCKEAPRTLHSLAIPLPPVELILPSDEASEGAQTHGLKVISQQEAGRSLTVVFEAPQDRSWAIKVRRNIRIANLAISGAQPTDEGFLLRTIPTPVRTSDVYRLMTVRLSW
jgi:glycogen debranching enzyme